MEKKKRLSLFSIVGLGVLVAVSLTVFLDVGPKAYIVFAGGSSPDSYGNKIRQVWICQPDTGMACDTFIYSGYTEGMNIEIEAGYNTHIIVAVNINKTLATDPGEAQSYTRVYFTVSGVMSNQLGTYWTYEEVDTGFYTVRYNSTEWMSGTDVTYTVTLDHDAYY